MSLLLQYPMHEGQIEFYEDSARFRILACGRRWGKTKAGAMSSVLMALESPVESVGFCVAPTYWHTQKQWTEFIRYCPKEIVVAINRADHSIELTGKRKVWFKSADNPDSLRSEGLHWMWMDEGGQIKEEAWTLALRPALMDKKGKGIFTGTPKGKNWYFLLWTRGQDPEQKDYKSWTYSSFENPYLDPAEMDDFKRDMPDMAYRQEILAEFIEEIGSVFRNVETCHKGGFEPATPAKQYVMGADLAKHQDFTVLTVLDNNAHMVHMDRFSDVDWVLQRKRIVNLARLYRARVLIDSTGVGDPIFDELQRSNLAVEGYKFTSASKKDLVENLSMMIDNREISWPEECRVLTNELKAYGYQIMPSGQTRYGAPEGMYDDCVISLALAAWLVKKPRGGIDFLR